MAVRLPVGKRIGAAQIEEHEKIDYSFLDDLAEEAADVFRNNTARIAEMNAGATARARTHASCVTDPNVRALWPARSNRALQAGETRYAAQD
jgi:hypothetical protein